MASASLPQIGGKGVFTKELEEALFDGHIDLAVHSLKDLPTRLPDGLDLAAVTQREDVRDALILPDGTDPAMTKIDDLPLRARIGTSSLRRASQLRHHRPDLNVVDIRGNIETRLRKLDTGEFDAIILACAGLMRLGLDDRIAERIDPSRMLPAVGQGALGIEVRREDYSTRSLLAGLNHEPTQLATEAERAVLRSLGGGCAVPIAAHAWIEVAPTAERLQLDALVAEVQGNRVIRDRISGPPVDADLLGQQLAQRLLRAGAGELLDGFEIGR